MNTVECNIRNSLYITNLLLQVKEMNTHAITELRNELFRLLIFGKHLQSYHMVSCLFSGFIKVVLGMSLVALILTQNLYFD